MVRRTTDIHRRLMAGESIPAWRPGKQEKRMLITDYRLILKSDAAALRLTSDEDGVFLENIHEGKTVYLDWTEVSELIDALTGLRNEA